MDIGTMLTRIFSFDELSLMTEVLVEAEEAAKEALEKTLEDPPLDDVTTGDAAESYSNLIAISDARVQSLKKLRSQFDSAYLAKGLSE